MKLKSAVTITITVIAGLTALSAGTAPPSGPQASTDRLVAVVPYVMDYEFFDHYYTQTLNRDAQYGEIEAWVKDNGGKPRTTIKLIEKNGGNVVVYNQVQYVPPKSMMPGGTAGFSFQDQAGKPVRWRFVMAYPPSAEGAGLNVTPNDTNLKLVYRDLGTLSDASSAVEIGGRVNEVQVWKEISQPPYFVAYRGTYTAGAHQTQLHADLEKFRFAGATTLKAGSKFEVISDSGKSRQLAVEGGGDNLVITQQADENGVSRELSVTGEGAIKSLKIRDGAHSSTVTFTPALRLAASAAERSPAEFQISVDKNHKLGNGTVRFAHTPEGAQLVWKVASPGWAKDRTIVQNLTVSDQGVTIAKVR